METPGRTSRAAMSKTSRASLHTFRIPSCSFLSRIFILCRPINFCSERGIPSFAYSGCCIESGTVLFRDRGYSGRSVPVKSNFGKGLM